MESLICHSLDFVSSVPTQKLLWPDVLIRFVGHLEMAGGFDFIQLFDRDDWGCDEATLWHTAVSIY